MNNREIGAKGEQEALEFLEKKGYILIEKNWHYSKNAEIDLIMKDADTLVFVEVKKRSTLNYGHPFEAITQNKIKNIKTAVQGYLKEKFDNKYINYRIDGIAIIQNPPSVEHLKNIC